MYGTIIVNDDNCDSDDSECVICLDPLDTENGDFVITPFDCKHRLHRMCFNDYVFFNTRDDTERVLNVKCPLCKGAIVLTKKNNWSSILFTFLFCVFFCSTMVTLYYRVFLIIRASLSR